MKKIFFLAMIMSSLSISGCADYHSNDEGKAIRPLASALTKLSSEVESVVRYEDPPANATDDDLLKLATKNDPGFLDTFSGYKLRVLSQERHAILLLCTEDRKRGLLEDLGCTSSLDRNLWKEDAVMPCEFTLSMELGCKRK